MNDDIDAKYTAICSAQTIYSDDKGFFGELFDSVKAECTDQWIEQMFSSSMNDIDKLKVLYNEPNVSDVLLGTLEHVAPIFTKKDEPFSRQRCKASEQLMATKDFDKAVLVLSQAVLRAPHKGSGRGKERKREWESENDECWVFFVRYVWNWIDVNGGDEPTNFPRQSEKKFLRCKSRLAGKCAN